MEMLFSCSQTVIYLFITAGTPCSGRKPGREGREREATNEWTDKHLIEPRKEGRKRMSCPVASSHFRPLPPSFAFSAIVAVSCFPGMLQRDGKEQGRGGATRGRLRGCQYFTCHSRVSPILLSFPRFLTLLRVKPTILTVAKSEMPRWKNDSMTFSTSLSMFPKRPLYPSSSPFRFLARFGTSAPLVGPSTTPRPGEPYPSPLSADPKEVRFPPSSFSPVPRSPCTPHTPAPARTHTPPII